MRKAVLLAPLVLLTACASRAADPTIDDLMIQARQSGLLQPERTAREDWAGAARRATTDAGWKSFIDLRRARLESWMAVPRENSRFVSGIGWKLVNPATGLPVTWTPDMPEPALDSSSAARDYWGAWVSNLRFYNIGEAFDAAVLYRVLGDKRYAEWAAQQLDFYAAQYANWPLQNAIGPSRMLGQVLDEATSAIALIDVARLLEPYVARTRSARWKTQLFYPIAQTIRPTVFEVHNIALWRNVALAAIAHRHGDTLLLATALNSATGLRSQLAAGVTSDGIWQEGTFGYNQYVRLALHQLLVSAHLAGRAAEVRDIQLIAQRLTISPFAFRFADNILPSPGDTSNRIDVANGWNYLFDFRTVPTALGVRLAYSARTWDTLVDPPTGAAPVAPTLPDVRSANYSGIRMAVLKSGDWQAFVHYGQVTQNHAQEEALTYELYHGTRPISVDPGSTSYGSPYQSNYFRRGAAQNVALVDGTGQASFAPGTVTQFDSLNATLTVQQPTYNASLAVNRSYQVTASGFTETTQLRLRNPTSAARRLGVLFHTACQVGSPDNRLTPLKAASAPTGPGFEYWTGVTSWTAPPVWTIPLTCASKTYSLTLRGPSYQRVYLATAPSTPLPNTRQALYLETEATAADFSTTVTVIN